MAKKLQNFINGKYSDAAGDSLDLIDPASEKVYGTAGISTAEDVDLAFTAASSAFDGWRDSTPGERQLALFRIADEMERRADEFADLESQDTGKPRTTLVEDEILLSVDQIRFFAGAARNLEGKSAGEYMPEHTSYIRREPIGVVAQVAPWNYPLNMAVWKFAPAIAAGNTTVLKPSETTPQSTLLLAEIAAEFLPPGVLNVIVGDRDTGRAMVNHPAPSLISVTGSVRAGMEVAIAASADLKRLHLELGGKAPVIVFDDADIPAAVAGIGAAGYFNAGQDCTAATRVLVQKQVHDEFVSEMSKWIKENAKTGAPLEEGILFGPVNNQDQYSRVLGFFDDLPSHIDVVVGGTQVKRAGYFIEATVLDNVQQDDRVIQQEIFGPVITVQTFETEAEALSKANGVNYGLAASVWTQNHGRALRMTRLLDFGCTWVNTHIPIVAEMPHGGFKHSGYGKDLSAYSFDDYTRIKHVMSYFGE
ncbi:MAG: aminobutyraldehyde dehydrogenase [Microbacteriaceae bacterium]|nr:aminobutyraldehyde dehydrogenase [Microbacteriaceae bacterium]